MRVTGGSVCNRRDVCEGNRRECVRVTGGSV